MGSRAAPGGGSRDQTERDEGAAAVSAAGPTAADDSAFRGASRPDGGRAPVWRQRRDHPASISGHRIAPGPANPQTSPAPDETVREGRAGRNDPDRCEVRKDRQTLGLSIHRARRLHALPGLTVVSPAAPKLQPRVPGRALPGVPLRDPEAAVRNGHKFPFAFMLAVQALGIKDRYIRPRRPQQNGRSNAVTGLTRRNSGSPAIRYVRSGRRGPPRLGRALQPRTLLTGSTRANSGRKARRSHARRRELMP